MTALNEAGITAPIFHPFFRCCTAPYFDDLGGERFARDEDGTAYYVPSDMTYSDWKQTFVDGGSKNGLKSTKTGLTKSLSNAKIDAEGLETLNGLNSPRFTGDVKPNGILDVSVEDMTMDASEAVKRNYWSRVMSVH